MNDAGEASYQMFFYSQKCAICEKPITQGQDFFGTWGVWLAANDPMYRFCDAPLHWDCYANWPQRERFAASYFQFWVENEENNAFWHRAYLDDEVLVTVSPTMNSAWVHLKSTGTRHDVKLENWAKWLAEEDETSIHRVLVQAIGRAKPVLRQHVPSVNALLGGIDEGRKRPVVERYREAQIADENAQRARLRRIDLHNDACERLMNRIERDGLTCPHCQVHSKDYRLSKRQGHESAVICKRCSWVVDPSSI